MNSIKFPTLNTEEIVSGSLGDTFTSFGKTYKIVGYTNTGANYLVTPKINSIIYKAIKTIRKAKWLEH